MYGLQEGKPVDPTMNSQAEYLNRINADIVFIQEIDQNTFRSAFRNQLEMLKNKTGLKFSAFQAPEDKEVIGGTGILSRFPLSEINTVVVPSIFRISDPNPIVIATANIDGELITLYSNHWVPRRYREPARLLAAQFALTFMNNDILRGRRIIFGGDLNAYICDPEVVALHSVLTDSLTVAESAVARTSNSVIDHILFRGSFNVKSCSIEPGQPADVMLSDHDIVIAEFAEGTARSIKVWTDQNTGYINSEGDRIVFDIVQNHYEVAPNEVGFELSNTEDTWWRKVLNMPDGEGNSWDIVAEGTSSGRNSLLAEQVKNGQVLTFSKKVAFAMKTVFRLGDLGQLKPQTLVSFTWVKD